MRGVYGGRPTWLRAVRPPDHRSFTTVPQPPETGSPSVHEPFTSGLADGPTMGADMHGSEAPGGTLASTGAEVHNLRDPALYFNRELSWLQFNERVLELSEDAGVPLLERVKFSAIFTKNLDEFFMVRVAGV